MRRLTPGLLLVALLSGAGIRSALRHDRPAELASASWISAGRGDRLARRFELPCHASRATLVVAAHPGASVRLGARELFRGGLEESGGAAVRIDATGALEAGANVLELELPRGGAVALALEITLPGAREVRIVSDRGFRCGEGVALVVPSPRRVKGALPWPAAPDAPRQLLFAARSGANGELLDLGVEHVGYPVVLGAPEGCRILYGESAAEALSDRPYQEDAVAGFDGKGRGFLRRAFRFARLVPSTPGARVGIVPAPEAVTPRGSFRCSDPALDHAYDVAAWTVRRCSRGLLEDGVKRDRQAWSGDLVVAVPAALYLYGPHPAIPATLEGLASRRTGSGALPPVYPLPLSWHLDDYVGAFILAVDAHDRLTGDAVAREALLPVVAEQEAWLARAMASGALVTEKRGAITDWMSHERRTGAVTYQQGMALLARARAAALLGDPARAAAAEESRVRVAARLARDEATGLYRDRLDAASGPVTHDGNVLALLSGLAEDPARTLDGIRSHLWGDVGPRAYLEPSADAPLSGQVVAPFMAGLEALARLEHGDASGACELMRRCWRPMVASGCAYELMDLSGAPAVHPGRGPHWTSLCHAWSSAPAWLLPAYVLGVRPEAPGFASYVIAPQGAELEWARGRVPAGDDDVDVSWRRNGDVVELTIVAPAGKSGRLDVRGLGSGATSRDGAEIPGEGPFPIPAGESRFTVVR